MRKPLLQTVVKIWGIMALALIMPTPTEAQIGEHRDDFSIGANAGYALSSVDFVPKVTQGLHGGMTMGFSTRYVCEKYYTMICSVLGEVNFTSMGWKEKILDQQDQKVVNTVTGLTEEYSRTINYIQIPVFAHLAWGREQKGMNFFFQAGPQFGLYLSESTSMNFDLQTANLQSRANKTMAQDTMSVEKKFDYGIAAGMGVEYSVPRIGHFLLEGRYYYGLGNIYGATKRDFFGRSNFGTMYIKLSYLIDLKKTKRQ